MGKGPLWTAAPSQGAVISHWRAFTIKPGELHLPASSSGCGAAPKQWCPMGLHRCVGSSMRFVVWYSARPPNIIISFKL